MMRILVILVLAGIALAGDAFPMFALGALAAAIALAPDRRSLPRPTHGEEDDDELDAAVLARLAARSR